jgi:hypothetical protein
VPQALPLLLGTASHTAPPYLLFQQCAAVSTQFWSTRTPAQWNERPLKRETCQGCEPRAHGAPEAAMSKSVSFPGSSASATGGKRGVGKD